ncbi:MAG TPA: NAD-dependent epimerase [Acidobacteriaceae bacterium]
MKFHQNGRERILVTGAAGFIGAHVARRLVDMGCDIVGIDNLNDYYDPRLKRARLGHLCDSPHFAFHEIDIADEAGMRRVFEEGEFRRVIHLAAQAGVRYSLENPRAYVDSNVVGFLNILEAVRRHECEHLVFASSSSVYGANTSVPFRESDRTDHPVSLYAATKKSNELFAHAYSHLYGVPMTGLRFFTVYGPWGRPDMAIFKFVDAILAGKSIQLYNNGQLSRDFTYIDDIVEGVVRVLDKPPTVAGAEGLLSDAKMRILNIGNNRPVEVLYMVRVIEEALGVQAKVDLAPMAKGDVYTTFASVDDLAALTGYSPAVRIEEGVARFVEWYRSYYGSLLDRSLPSAKAEYQEAVASH